MQKAIIYTRVSTDEQALGFSLRDQESKLRQYCASRGIEIAKHFQNDHSAKDFERPEFQKLIEFVKQNKGLVNKVWMVKWDRFSRNATESYAMIDIFKKFKVEFNTTEQYIDFSIPEQKMMLSIYLTAPEIENDRRAMNTRNGMRRAMKEGRWVNKAPFGYKNVLNDFKKPVLEKSDKAPLIEEVFKLYATGMYEKEELRKDFRYKGMVFSKNGFHKLLMNTLYCGKILIPEFLDEPREIVKGIHEPIISEELFNQVQNILSGRRHVRNKPTKLSITLPLRGNLICSKCGKNLTGSTATGRHGGKYLYYHCQSGCSERFRADNAHKIFNEWLQTISIKPEIATLYLTILEDVFKTEEGDREAQIRKLDKERKNFDTLLTMTGMRLVEGDIDKDDHKRIKEKLNTDILKITNRINELLYTESDFMNYTQYGISLLTNLPKYYSDCEIEVKRKLLGLIFPNKLYFTEGKYRTPKPSEVFSFLCYENNRINKELTSENGSQFPEVAHRGLKFVNSTFSIFP